MAKKLEQYGGQLTLEQLAEGMNLATKNARGLYEDAKLLLDAGRYPSAFSLAVLAVEEAGKLSILRCMTSHTEPERLKGTWKEYRSHTKKNVAWALMEHINLDGATKLSDLAPLYDKSSEHPYILDQLKQLAFYTDCLGKGKWTYPGDVITEQLVRHILFVVRASTGGREVTARELQLWKDYVGDVTRFSSQQDGTDALTRWYEAMQAEGLYEDGPNRMQTFIEQGISVQRAAKIDG